MLAQLIVQRFALISDLNLEFEEGMTVLTGETGAGKSILIDALLLLLGERAEPAMIQPGAERCTLSAVFDLKNLPEARKWLAENSLEDEEQCVLRRIIQKEGPSRALINDHPVSNQLLKQLGVLLVNIHGQHAHQALLRLDKQRLLLDAFGGHELLLQQVKAAYDEWNAVREKLEALTEKKNTREAEVALLQFQVQEFERINLLADEFEELDQRQRQLAHAGEFLEKSARILDLLAGNEAGNAKNFIEESILIAQSLEKMEPKFSEWITVLEQASIATQEVAREVQAMADKADLDPKTLQQVEQRLGVLHDLARKHKISPQNLYSHYQVLKEKLFSLQHHDELIETLMVTLEEKSKNYVSQAGLLSEARQKSAQRLKPLIEKSLHQLGMSGAKFEIKFSFSDKFSTQGQESIEFWMSSNPGHPVQPLAKIASGGELSRVSLALQVQMIRRSAMPTLIFDEVDVGIGGGIAEVVGHLLRQLGEQTQVMCVTHLPQVAAQGHHHFLISKKVTKGLTETKVASLDQKEKIAEIARMLGGVKMTEQTLAHAKEMLGVT